MDLTNAINLIKAYEGILDGDPSTVNLDPYLCPAGYWTIGWGHVVLDVHGKQIKGQENKALAYSMYPKGITMDEAVVLLNDDIRRFVVSVQSLVKVPLTNNQLCALISFIFNIGVGAFKKSTLLLLLNGGDYKSVPSQLKRWDKAKGKVLSGLVKRRAAEAELWNKG